MGWGQVNPIYKQNKIIKISYNSILKKNIYKISKYIMHIRFFLIYKVFFTLFFLTNQNSFYFISKNKSRGWKQVVNVLHLKGRIQLGPVFDPGNGE